MDPKQPLLRVENLCKSYYMNGALESQVLFDLNLGVDQGEFVAVMGHSGSGKSTLLNILGCLDTPTRGTYFLDGRDVASLPEKALAKTRNHSIGFVFQGFNLLARMSALDNVALPLLYAGVGRTPAYREARSLLEQTGLGNFAHHAPNQLSGGQQQRVAICRALVNRPRLILADEPTGNLDSQTSREIMEIFLGLNLEQGITIVLITHEAEIAAYARRLVRLSDGRVVHDHPFLPRNAGEGEGGGRQTL